METLVIYRLGSLGDTIVSLPCFHLIEQAYPDHQRLVLTNVPVSGKAAPLEMVIGPGGFIHGTIAYPYGMRDPSAFWDLKRSLRKTRASTLVYITAVRSQRLVWRDVAFFRLCGFSTIIGAPTTSLLANNLPQEDRSIERESSRLMRTLAPLGQLDLKDRTWWDLRLTATEQQEAQNCLAELGGVKFIAVNTGGKAAEKDWGIPRWEQLLARLGAALPGLALVSLGAGEDRQRADELFKAWPGRTLNLCGSISPRGSGAVLTHANLFIGHDSGPFHLADAVGTPAVGLFGSYNAPRKWHPSGPDTRVIHSQAGMDEIMPQQVAQTGLEVIRDQTLSS